VTATSATSPTSTDRPSRAATTTAFTCSGLSNCPTARTLTSFFDSRTVPALALRFAAPTAATRSSTVSPRWASFSLSKRIWSSRSRPPSTPTSLTPSTRSIRGFTRSSAKSWRTRISNGEPSAFTAPCPPSSTIHAM